MAAFLDKGPGVTTLPLDPAQGLPELADAEDRRSSAFEQLLLLADDATITAARAWQEQVWELFRYVDNSRPDPGDDGFVATYAAGAERRDEFYACARSSLRIDGISKTPPYPLASLGGEGRAQRSSTTSSRPGPADGDA